MNRQGKSLDAIEERMQSANKAFWKDIMVCRSKDVPSATNNVSGKLVHHRHFSPSYTCSSDYNVYDGLCTYTHLSHAHFFCCTVCLRKSAHFPACAHTRMAQGREKGVCRMSVFDLFFAFSPLMFHPSLLFLFPVHLLAELSRPESAGLAKLRTFIEELGNLAKSDANTDRS